MNAVIGANGLVGNALMHFLSDAVGTYHNGRDNLLGERQYVYLDITDRKKVDEFFETHKPRRVFLTASNPWVDGCEDPATDHVNVSGTCNVVSSCHFFNAQLVYFSSSYVFDGESQVPYRHRDETFPVNRYGRQKEQVERIIRNRENLQWLIIRTVGVFGREGTAKNFVAQVERAVRGNKKIYVPCDQTMNPIWAMDLARLAVKLSDRYSCEIFHVAGDKCLTKYEFAINVAYKLGCKKPHELIVGMKSSDMRQMANRPRNGCLDCGQLPAHAMSVPVFERGLRKFLASEYGVESRRTAIPS